MSISEASHPAGIPAVEIFSHCDSAGDAVGWLNRHAEEVVEQCLSHEGTQGEPLLGTLPTIEVSLVSDAAIAGVHGEFMDDPTPTDVITFQHGEILISLDTAARSAVEQGHPPKREALLYLIHGLLHLNGFDDRTTAARAEMEAAQARILEAVSPFPGAENPG